MAFSLAGWSQQTTQYTNFMYNSFAINPAVAGLQECLVAKMGYRTQWVGFESQPQTISINANQRLKKISNERGALHGIGIEIEADRTGPSTRSNIHVAYAIHLPLNRKTRISAGLAIGLQQYRFDAALISVPDPNDPIVNKSASEIVFPDIKAGLWMYGKRWFVGLSAKQLTNATLNDIGNDTQLQPHFDLMAGRIFESNDKISFIPAALLKFTANSKPAFDANVWVDYDDVVAVGLGFRSEDAVSGMLKFNFLEYFSLAYAYDFTYSKMRYGSSNTHEVIIGISACPRNKKAGFVPCNAYD